MRLQRDGQAFGCSRPGPLQPRGLRDPRVASRYAAYSHESFGGFLWPLVGHGSLGHSLLSGASLTVWALQCGQVTLSLVAFALFMALAIALPLGIAWDRRPRWARRPAAIFAHLSLALTPLVVGIWLSYYVGFRLAILPPGGYANFFFHAEGQPGGPVEWATYLILPGLTLGLPVAAVYTRGVRDLARDVRRAAELAAAAEADVDAAADRAWEMAVLALARWLLRDIGVLMGAAVFAEVIFGVPGAGYSLVRSGIASGDTAVVQSILILASLVAGGLHLAGNLVGGALSEQWRSG